MGADARTRPEPVPPSTGPLDNEGPVYIGGLDRSGKTTLSGFLTSHARVAIPPVGSNMWTYFHARFGDLSVDRNYERCLAALLRYKHVRILEPDVARVDREFRQGPATYARLFSLFLIHYAERQGKARWGAQTGLIERYAPDLFAAYQGLRIIHMIRDPRDRYLASIERWPEGKGRAGGATARWVYSTRLGERHLARYPDRYLIVRFEDLVSDTETTLARVCRFLGEELQPAMLTMSGSPKHRDRLAAAAAPGELLSPDHVGRYAGRVPAAELAFMQHHAGRVMRRHGYRLEPIRHTGVDRVRYPLIDWPSQFGRMVAWRTVEELQQRFPRHLGRKPGRRMILDPVPVPAG